jgi:hypothetical protein
MKAIPSAIRLSSTCTRAIRTAAPGAAADRRSLIAVS